MRAVLQRVKEARVEVEGRVTGAIGPGLLVLLGVGREDGPGETAWMAAKVAGLRIFPDAGEKLNLSVKDIGGQVLVVSQFTLWADCHRGKRPSFTRAAGGPEAEAQYQAFIRALEGLGLQTARGAFGQHMQVHLVNDGPVTILLDTGKTF